MSDGTWAARQLLNGFNVVWVVAEVEILIVPPIPGDDRLLLAVVGGDRAAWIRWQVPGAEEELGRHWPPDVVEGLAALTATLRELRGDR